ncbi:MAG: hypothetical protein QOH05_776 [Acetobacteraceae bacterium]|jgi:hypothetical protein|nr:hypothetical protein [Acetobacteraceae bacterium]
MVIRRFHLLGLFAVLLALMAQLGAGASVPRIDPVAVAGTLCHADDDGGGPAKSPAHPADCPICTLCVALHAPSTALSAAVTAPIPPSIGVVLKTELPPPSTAPPSPHRPPGQPRAPPILS